MSADTIVPGYTNPQNLNRYSYVLNNPLRYTDPTGHMRVTEGPESKGCSDPKYCNKGKPKSEEQLKKMRNEKKDKDSKDKVKEKNKDKIVDLLYKGATVSQNIATMIDIPFAITEGIFIVGECIAAPPEGCATGAFMGQAAFNITGANLAETVFSGASLALTFTADLMDDGTLGENTSTSFATFVVGGLMFDPIGDLIVDGYASGYSNGVFNGFETLMSGGPLVIPKP